jgi:RHS repeat-associated protein
MKAVSTGLQTVYVYDIGGKLVAEYSSGPVSVPPCHTCFLSSDHLGSTRLVTDENGNTVSRHDYIPFGEEIQANSGGRDGTFGTFDFVNQKFTGKERDPETGLDYFGARYMSGALGRFTSPDRVGDGLDPVPVPWANFENPQSLNLYAYVRNNPLSNSDPDGNDCVVQTRTDYDRETVTVSSGNCDNVNTEDGQTKTYIAGTVDAGSIQSNGSGGITFGYTPYEGGGGVADLQGASIPDNPDLAYDWQNNAQGYQTLRTTAATVGSVKGVALFYTASAATAACVLFCSEAAALPEAANEVSLKAMAYLESNGIPATRAAEYLARMGVDAGKVGAGTALAQAWRQLVPKLNDAVRDYHRSSNAH